MKKLLLSITVFLIYSSSYTQNIKKCITTQVVNDEIQISKEYKDARKASIKHQKTWEKSQSKQNPTITIPVVVHIIYKTNHPNIGYGTNIPGEQIEDAFRILNEDYSKTNPEFPNPPRNTFLSLAGNPDLEFCLAMEDEQGNPTNGITRTIATSTNGTFDADGTMLEKNGMKLTSLGGNDGWDPSRYLNIWVCDLVNSQGGGQTLGYSYLPGLPSWNAWRDGLVVDYRYFGTTGMAAPSSDGRTPTHEIGHYLGLSHTFCESQSGGCCDNDDNNVNDTPACYDSNNDGPYFGPVTSSTNNNTCNDLLYGFSSNLLDMDENYMSYAANTWMFTQDQVAVMQATLSGYRNTLRNSISNGTTVNCSNLVSLEDIKYNQTFNIYPNPSHGYLTIKSHEGKKIDRISIRNILGDLVYSKHYNDGEQLDISYLKNGIYFVEMHTINSSSINKIILDKNAKD